MRPLYLLMAVVAFFAVACGDSDDDVIDDGTGDPVVAGVCVEDQPDCDDVGVVSGDDVPSDDGDDADGGGLTPVGGMLVDGGLTVSDALATDATGTIAVKGFLFDDGTGPRLCEVLLESFPPQCGGAQLQLTGFGIDDVPDLPAAEDIVVNTEQGVSWTDEHISLFGQMSAGALMVEVNSI